MARGARRSRLLAGSLILLAIPGTQAIPVLRRVSSDDPLTPNCATHHDDYADLQNQRVYALIYTGRKEYLELLNPYLERNLRVNGGVVDQVLFALVNYRQDDLIYLSRLQNRNPEHYVVPRIAGGGWDVIWRLAEEPGAIYIKIDDDIVFIEDGAIPELVREKRRGRFLFVSANVVNHGILSAVHQELVQLRWLAPTRDRPFVDGDPPDGPWRYKGEVIHDPNFRIEHTFYSDCVWRRWECAALVHENFLHRVADNTTCAFDFGVFDFHAHGYGTMSDGIGRSIDWNDNFFAFQTEDFSDIDWAGVATDDEREMSTRHPARRNHHAAALGRALVVHFSFSVQEKGLRGNTTLLERYRDLAMQYAAENAQRFYGGQLQPPLGAEGPPPPLRVQPLRADL